MLSSSSVAQSTGQDGSAPRSVPWVELRTERSDRGAAQTGEISSEAVDEAYRRGFAEGSESAERKAREALRSAVDAATSVLDEVRMGRDAWSSHLKQNLATLAAGMAAAVIDRSVDEEPEIFVELAEKIVATFPMEEDLRVRLHPADHVAITEGEAASRVVGTRSVRWIPDPDVKRGGCIVEGPDRIVDGRVDEALRRVIKALSDD